MSFVPAVFRKHRHVCDIFSASRCGEMAVKLVLGSCFLKGSEPVGSCQSFSPKSASAQIQKKSGSVGLVTAAGSQVPITRSTGSTGSTVQSQNWRGGDFGEGRKVGGRNSADGRVWSEDRRSASSSSPARPSQAPLPPFKSTEAGWNQGDARAVREAMNEATHLAPTLSTQPSPERGNGVLLGRSLEELEKLAVDLGEVTT